MRTRKIEIKKKSHFDIVYSGSNSNTTINYNLSYGLVDVAIAISFDSIYCVLCEPAAPATLSTEHLSVKS